MSFFGYICHPITPKKAMNRDHSIIPRMTVIRLIVPSIMNY